MFYAQNKHIEIRINSLNVIDSFLKEKSSYGIVIGPSPAGKTTISNFIKNLFKYELIEWEPTIAMLKEKLGTEAEALDEVSFEQVKNYFSSKLKNYKGTILFDGFPYSNEQAQEFIDYIGVPEFIINLSISKESLCARFKLKFE